MPRFVISPEVLLRLGMGRYEVVMNEIPVEAQFKRAEIDFQGQIVIWFSLPDDDTDEEWPTPVIRHLDWQRKAVP